MEFSSARAIEQIVWQMRLADYPRSRNRARIDSLANGAPPYPEDEASANGVSVNVNDLSLTRLSHDARMQLYQAFNKPGSFFTARTDMGVVDKRQERGIIVTKEANRILKQSDLYFQTMQSKIALLVLHGIGPSMWQNSDDVLGTPLELADVMVPSRTKLTFENLPFFAVWRSYTARELKRLTRHCDSYNPGWNMDAVNRAIEWVDQETAKLYGGTTWSEYWVPEKSQERIKEDAGLYSSDIAQTIDCWDFYYWDDVGDHEGWRRRIIFDAEGGQGAWAARGADAMPDKNLLGDSKGMFLYDSGNRVVADDISNILHFQFADLSAVAPFRYHSVRSLGFLLYAACHLQNRLRCAFSESVFENLMMYMRVSSLDDAERALKIELKNRGIIDESVKFLNPAERWQPNAQMAELGLNEFKQIISDNSSSYSQNTSMSRDRVEKTKFQVMAEVNAMQTLVSSALQMAYRYQASEYRETFRRLMNKDSTCILARGFRARCMKRGVPEKLMNFDAWDIEPERIVGGGNKTLEMAIAQQLMEWRSAYAPESQQEILRMATLAITDDASQTSNLVPFEQGVSNSKHDAMLAFGSLMSGSVVQFRKDQSELEICQTLIVELTLAVNQAKAMGNMVSEDKLFGMQNVVRTISELIASISQDKTQKQTAKQMAQLSGNLANEIKGFAQRLAQQKKAQGQAQQDGTAAETQAKIQAQVITAQAKADIAKTSHAQRTAQKQAQWELSQQQKQMQHKADVIQKQQDHMLQLDQKAQDHAVDIAAKTAQAALDIKKAKKTQEQSTEGDE